MAFEQTDVHAYAAAVRGQGDTIALLYQAFVRDRQYCQSRRDSETDPDERTYWSNKVIELDGQLATLQAMRTSLIWRHRRELHRRQQAAGPSGG